MAAIEDFVEMHLEEGNEQNGLSDFLSEVSLMSDLENEDSGDGERITLMTVHSAKGLEFPTVFIVGLEEDLFPNSGARESLREMEEERRLLYVAITRAKDHCIMSFAKSRYKYGQFGFCEPSCFIKEINPVYIVMPNGSGVQQRPQQQQSYRSGGMFGATNNNYGRRSAYGYGQEENGRPQFGRSTAQPSAFGRSAVPQRSNEPAAGATGAPSYTSRPANLYRVSDVQRFSQGSAGNIQPGISVGAIVQHERFGVGEVQATEGVGENAKATIKFQNAGVKTLLLKFAKLKIIG
jgi:DNA helicase-2/ATP-dependent DNA helicase PcrA